MRCKQTRFKSSKSYANLHVHSFLVSISHMHPPHHVSYNNFSSFLFMPINIWLYLFEFTYTLVLLYFFLVPSYNFILYIYFALHAKLEHVCGCEWRNRKEANKLFSSLFLFFHELKKKISRRHKNIFFFCLFPFLSLVKRRCES